MEKVRANVTYHQCHALMSIIDLYKSQIKDVVDYFNIKSLYKKLLLKSFSFGLKPNKKKPLHVNINEFKSWKKVYDISFNHLQAINESVLDAHRMFYEDCDRWNEVLRSKQTYELNK